MNEPRHDPDQWPFGSYVPSSDPADGLSEEEEEKEEADYYDYWDHMHLWVSPPSVETSS